MANAVLAAGPGETLGGLMEMCHATRSLLEVEMGLSGNSRSSILHALLAAWSVFYLTSAPNRTIIRN